MNIADRLLDLIAPHACVGCGRVGRLLCDSCSKALPRARGCCYRCGSADSGGATCEACVRATPLIRSTALTAYQGPAKSLVASLKFERARAAADEIAALMIADQEIRQALSPGTATVVVPLPTASGRIRRRGYDQAVLIARSLACRSGCGYAMLLEHAGRTQQRGSSRAVRFQQARAAYRLRHGVRLPKARYVLIDDVMTTGASLESAALALRSGGVEIVEAVVFARA